MDVRVKDRLPGVGIRKSCYLPFEQRKQCSHQKWKVPRSLLRKLWNF